MFRILTVTKTNKIIENVVFAQFQTQRPLPRHGNKILSNKIQLLFQLLCSQRDKVRLAGGGVDDLLAILKLQIAGFVCDGSEPRAPRNPKCQSGGAVRLVVKAAATCRLRAAGLQSPAGSPAAAILLTSLYLPASPAHPSHLLSSSVGATYNNTHPHQHLLQNIGG